MALPPDGTGRRWHNHSASAIVPPCAFALAISPLADYDAVKARVVDEVRAELRQEMPEMTPAEIEQV